MFKIARMAKMAEMSKMPKMARVATMFTMFQIALRPKWPKSQTGRNRQKAKMDKLAILPISKKG